MCGSEDLMVAYRRVYAACRQEAVNRFMGEVDLVKYFDCLRRKGVG